MSKMKHFDEYCDGARLIIQDSLYIKEGKPIDILCIGVDDRAIVCPLTIDQMVSLRDKLNSKINQNKDG